MGQKTPSSSLRIRLNRQYDSCWFKEPQYYSDLFFKDFQYRQYLQDLNVQLPSNLLSGRILSTVHPKQHDVQVFTCQTGRYKLKREHELMGLKGTTPKPKSQRLVFQDFLSTKLREQQFGANTNTKHSPLSFTSGEPTYVDRFKNMEKTGQALTQCYTGIQMNKCQFTSSAHFFSSYLVNSFKKKNEYRKALRNCMRVAKNSPDINGIRITFAGRFNGVERARVQTKSWGPISMQNFSTHLDYSSKAALTSAGLMGVKVWVSYNK